MTEENYNLRAEALRAKIKACDPFVAKTLADYYDGLLDKDERGLNAIELGVKSSIEKYCLDPKEVEKRELDGVIDAVNGILSKKNSSRWSSNETAFLKKLEEIVFVKLNENKVNELDQIDQFVESILKLDYPKKLPTFKLAENKRNIYNYFSLSLESISEKIKESTISAKAVNNMMQYLPDTLMIVTDKRWNIRFVGSGIDDFFEKDHTLMIDENLKDYVPDFEKILDTLEINSHVHQLNANVKRNANTTDLIPSYVTIIPSKLDGFSNGEQDEIEEYVVKIDRITPIEKPEKEISKQRSEILENVIEGLGHLNTDRVDEEWEIINTCLESLIQLKSKKNNVLIDEFANYDGGIISQKELIDIHSLVKTIATDLRDFPGFDEMTLVLQNKKASPFSGYFDMIYSVLRHLVTTAIKFRKVHAEFSEIEICVMDAAKGSIIIVKDNGIGIPKRWQRKIFENDFKVNGSTNTDDVENGLYFVKECVVRMGGDMDLVSNPNEGSTFTIHLFD